MNRLLAATLCFAILLMVHGNEFGQFFDRIANPEVSVPLAHPRDLSLKVSRSTFGPANGDKAYYKRVALATDANYERPR